MAFFFVVFIIRFIMKLRFPQSESIDFSYLNNSPNIELSYDAFLKDINELVHRHVPSGKCTRKELRFLYKTWISKRMQKMIKIRDRIFKKYLESSKPNRQYS